MTDITIVLKDLGIKGNIQGFYHLRTAIKLTMFNFDMVHHMCKSLYPTVARTHETTPSRVERAMRHAIRVSWDNADRTLRTRIFGNSNEVPCNGDYIASVADYLLNKENEKERNGNNV